MHFSVLLLAALASDPLLQTWTTRTGLSLAVPEEGHMQPAEGGVALVGSGISLLLSPASGDSPLQAALDAQLAPFLIAGSPKPTPRKLSCTLGGKPATCLEATVEVAPGASLRLLAGHRPNTDWTAVCLQRAKADTSLCDAVLQADPS